MAFPLQREIVIFCARWWIASDEWDPSCCVCMQMANGFHNINEVRPKDSKTRGMKSTPSSRHSSPRAASFLSFAMRRACPGVMAVHMLQSYSNCRGDITVTSRAAGRPPDQLGRKMSAGRLLVPGIREGTSFLGAKVASRAADRIESQIKL